MKLTLTLLLSLSLIVILTNTNTHSAELAASWSFDSDTAEDVEDVSGNGHDGVGLETEIVEGKFGNAMSFDGTNSQVEVPHDEILNFADGVTVEAWTKPSSYNDLSAVAQKWGDGSGRRQYLLCFVGPKVRFYISGSGGTWPSAESAAIVEIDEWTHIAGTYDGSTIRVYINGELDAEAPSDEGLFGSDIAVWIGGYGPDDEFGNNRHFPGVIDEVRFWDGALSEKELQASMSSPSAVDATGKLSVTWGSIKDAH